LTDQGKLARLVAKYKPEVRILAASINLQAVNNMNTYRNVIGMKIPTFQKSENIISSMID